MILSLQERTQYSNSWESECCVELVTSLERVQESQDGMFANLISISS